MRKEGILDQYNAMPDDLRQKCDEVREHFGISLVLFLALIEAGQLGLVKFECIT